MSAKKEVVRSGTRPTSRVREPVRHGARHMWSAPRRLGMNMERANEKLWLKNPKNIEKLSYYNQVQVFIELLNNLPSEMKEPRRFVAYVLSSGELHTFAFQKKLVLGEEQLFVWDVNNWVDDGELQTLDVMGEFWDIFMVKTKMVVHFVSVYDTMTMDQHYDVYKSKTACKHYLDCLAMDTSAPPN